jgi:hypothetical protein
MSDHRKLTSGEMNILRLIQKGADAEGWAPVSRIVSKLFTSDEMPISPMPRDLCEFEHVGDDGAGRARLTDAGKNLLAAMAWL